MLDRSSQSQTAAVFCLVLALITTGMAFMIYEIVFLRELAITLGGTVYASSATLSSVMLGLFLGSQVFGFWSSRTKHVVSLFVGIEFFLCLAALYTVPALRLAGNIDAWGWRFVVSFCLVLIPSFLTGGEIPVAMQFLEKRIPPGRLGMMSGWVYGADTLGALAGALLFPFFLLPYVGSYQSTLLAGVANGLSGMVLLVWCGFSKRWAMALILGLVMCLSAGFSKAGHLVDKRTAIISPVGKVRFIANPQKDQRKHWVQETAYQRIHVVMFPTKAGNPVKNVLYLDGISQATTYPHPYPDSAYIPLMAHPNPQRVLVIGCGDGDLIAKILKDPRVKHVDHVEIDPAVIQTARRFFFRSASHNGQFVWDDPRVRLIIGDGRQHLKKSDKPYDIIFCDLPHAGHEGGSLFYSAEFFRLAYDKLTPEGLIFTHAYSADHSSSFMQTGWPHLLLAARSVRESFGDQVYLFSKQQESVADDLPASWDAIIVGAKGEPDVSMEAVISRFDQLTEPTPFLSPKLLTTLYEMGRPVVDWSKIPLTTDDNPHILLARRWQDRIFDALSDDIVNQSESLGRRRWAQKSQK